MDLPVKFVRVVTVTRQEQSGHLACGRNLYLLFGGSVERVLGEQGAVEGILKIYPIWLGKTE